MSDEAIENLGNFYFKVKSLIKSYLGINLFEIRNDLNRMLYDKELPLIVDFILSAIDEDYLVFLIGRPPSEISIEKLNNIKASFNKFTNSKIY